MLKLARTRKQARKKLRRQAPLGRWGAPRADGGAGRGFAGMDARVWSAARNVGIVFFEDVAFDDAHLAELERRADAHAIPLSLSLAFALFLFARRVSRARSRHASRDSTRDGGRATTARR